MDGPRQSTAPLTLALVSFAATLAAAGSSSPQGEPPSGVPRAAMGAAEASEFWAFQPPSDAPPPNAPGAMDIRNAVDAFVEARLHAANIEPASKASRYTLIRRLSFDLTGLPPDAEAVDAFLGDPRPDAWEQLVDRTLASPRFGERLASPWLNAVRYAEDQAHQVGDDTKFFYPNAWRYRQWVIDAFNRDLPYDQFIRLQLAADFLGTEGSENLAALGFLGLGPQYYNRNRLEVMADEWEDRVDTVTRTFLALTVACARCHDHKFDPITTEDYYALAGVFASTKMLNKVYPEQPGEVSDEEKAKLHLHIVEEGEIQDLPVFIRGDVERKGLQTPRRFLEVLSQGEPQPFSQGSGRLELAEAIADPRNPLTARVMVNRVWDLIFGVPLVATASNFGSLGSRPDLPELLDHLAARFVREGWSIKDLARTLVLSNVYLRSVDASPESVAADPVNRLWSRMPRRRLTVEMWRDTLLSVSRELSEQDGPSLELSDPANLRRTVFGRVSRLELDFVLQQFDYPDPNIHASGRATTSTPIQKLLLLNSPFVLERCEAIARNTLQHSPENTAARIDALYRNVYARYPEDWERETGLAWLTTHGDPDLERWTAYTHVLVTANTFHYRD